MKKKYKENKTKIAIKKNPNKQRKATNETHTTPTNRLSSEFERPSVQEIIFFFDKNFI